MSVYIVAAPNLSTLSSREPSAWLPECPDLPVPYPWPQWAVSIIWGSFLWVSLYLEPNYLGLLIFLKLQIVYGFSCWTGRPFI